MHASNGLLMPLTLAAITFMSCIEKQSVLHHDKLATAGKEERSLTRDSVWKQNEFVLSTFYAVTNVGDTAIYRKILTRTKEAGINLVEITFQNRVIVNMALGIAETEGIKILAQDLDAFSGFQTQAPSFTEDTVISNVSRLNSYQMLEGYYVWDEPFTQNLTQAKELRELFREHDPSRLAFTVMLPSYGPYVWSDSAYPRYVDSYLSTINPDVISFNYYPFRDNLASTTLITNDLWKDFGYIRRKALVAGKPLWYYFQAVSIQPDVTSIMNLERIRVQMYAALAYGTKGLSYYTSHRALIDPVTYEKTTQYNDLKTLNEEVKRVGNFLLGKQSEKLYHTGISSQNRARYYLDQLSLSDLLNTAPNDLVIGVFGDASTAKALLITNKNFSSTKTGTITLKSPKKVSEFNKSNGTITVLSNSTSSIAISLPPGSAALYIVE